MAHLVKIFKARKLRKKWKCYKRLKAIRMKWERTDYESSRASVESTAPPEWLIVYRKKIKSWSTVQNVGWNSVLGFLGGVILTYAFFTFLQLGVNISLLSSTYISALAGITLSLGLAFSTNVRCYVLLLLPVFFSKQARQALLAYALFLAFTGPARNTMHNLGILSDSMICGQQVVKKTFRQIIEMVKTPSKSIKEMLLKIKDGVEKASATIKSVVVKFRRVVMIILEVIKRGSVWLKSVVHLCNKKVGTPFQRCMKSFDAAFTECKAKLGVLDFTCHMVYVTKAICYTVKSLDCICLFTEFIPDRVVDVARKKLRKFHLHTNELFYVSIHLNHSFKFRAKASNKTKYFAKTILQRLSEKVEKLQSLFSVFGFMYSLFFVILFAKVYYYKCKYLSSDTYDNIYINKYIVDLDIRRTQMGKETVLPLEPRERKKYGKPTAIRLLECERSRVAQSMFLLCLTSFKVITFVAVDYCLFSILLTVYQAGRDALREVEAPEFGAKVEGEGVVADFYRKLGKAFEVPKNPYMSLTPIHCLPDPQPPDTRRSMQIGFLVLLCWILTLTEAYGLRLRSVVMSYYYPDRARERAVWLYNHILLSRGSFVRFTRRQLRKKFGTFGVMPVERTKHNQKLLTNFRLLGLGLRRRGSRECVICAVPEDDLTCLKICRTPDCLGRYCKKCLESLVTVCTVCQHPLEYEDISDVSEEMDSSEEDCHFRELSRNSTCDSSEEIKKMETFESVEKRESFRDVEANKIEDYVKKDDLNVEIECLQQKLSTLLTRFSSKAKVSVYREIKLKLIQKINSLKRLKAQGLCENPRLMPGSSFGNLDQEENIPKIALPKESSEESFSSLKETRSLCENFEKAGKKKPGRKESDDDNSDHCFFSFYFVQSEKESLFRGSEPESEIRFNEGVYEDENYIL